MPTDGRGLPAARARELILAAAWHEVAGPALEPLVESLDVRRGVLEIQVATADSSWLPTLAEVLPELAARVARRARGVTISRYRIHGLGAASPPVVRRLPEPTEPSTLRSPLPGAERERPRTTPAVDPHARLEALMEAYLRRR